MIVGGFPRAVTSGTDSIQCCSTIDVEPIQSGIQACRELINDMILVGVVCLSAIRSLGTSRRHCHFDHQCHYADDEITRVHAQPHDDITDNSQ